MDLIISDINKGLRAYRDTPDAILLDVRGHDEYIAGHIPGSLNIPLDTLDDIYDAVSDMNTPLFVYCRSGNRSVQAAVTLREIGYDNAVSISGISNYNGIVEK